MPRVYFDREFFEDRAPGDYDGIVWRLYWPPELHGGAPFSSPSRFGIHLCGCLLHYCHDDMPDTIWRLGPYRFAHNDIPAAIVGTWPD
jgi:hypothetical protein